MQKFQHVHPFLLILVQPCHPLLLETLRTLYIGYIGLGQLKLMGQYFYQTPHAFLRYIVFYWLHMRRLCPVSHTLLPDRI